MNDVAELCSRGEKAGTTAFHTYSVDKHQRSWPDTVAGQGKKDEAKPFQKSIKVTDRTVASVFFVIEDHDSSSSFNSKAFRGNMITCLSFQLHVYPLEQ